MCALAVSSKLLKHRFRETRTGDLCHEYCPALEEPSKFCKKEPLSAYKTNSSNSSETLADTDSLSHL